MNAVKPTRLAVVVLNHKIYQVQISVMGRCNFSDSLPIISHCNTFSDTGERSLTCGENQSVSCSVFWIYIRWKTAKIEQF